MMSPAAALPSLDGLSQLPFMPPPAAASAPPITSRTEMGMGAGAEEPPLWGNLATLAKSAQGSRYLQAALPRMSPAELGRVRDELTPSLLELSKHTFGNYMVTQLLGLPAHLGFGGALAGAIKGHVVDLVKHVHGSRVVQNALVLRAPRTPSTDRSTLTRRSRRRRRRPRGRARWPPPRGGARHARLGACAAFARTRAPFVLAQCAKHLGALATSQHGCRVLQRVLRLAGDRDGGGGGGGRRSATRAPSSRTWRRTVRQLRRSDRALPLRGAADGQHSPPAHPHARCVQARSNVAEALLSARRRRSSRTSATRPSAPRRGPRSAPRKEAAAAAKAGETFANGGAAAAPPQPSMMEHGYVNYVLKKLLSSRRSAAAPPRSTCARRRTGATTARRSSSTSATCPRAAAGAGVIAFL